MTRKEKAIELKYTIKDSTETGFRPLCRFCMQLPVHLQRRPAIPEETFERSRREIIPAM